MGPRKELKMNFSSFRKLTDSQVSGSKTQCKLRKNKLMLWRVNVCAQNKVENHNLGHRDIGESNIKLKMRNRQRRKMVSTISGFNHHLRAKFGAAKTCDDCLDTPEGQTWLSEKENYPSHGMDGSMSRSQLSHSTSNLWCLTWMHNRFCSSDAAFSFLWGSFYVCSCPYS